MRWNEDQLAAYQSRMNQPTKAEPDSAPESSLQSRIERCLTEHGLYWFHDRSRGENAPGFPDLVVAAHRGKTFWLELKSKKGRLTEDQKRVRLILTALGHEFHEVRSFKQFLSIIGPSLRRIEPDNIHEEPNEESLF